MLTEDQLDHYISSHDATVRGAALIAAGLFVVAKEIRALGNGTLSQPGAVNGLRNVMQEGIADLSRSLDHISTSLDNQSR